MNKINDLIMENEKLIYSIMNNFKNYTNKDDLYQAGCLGMILAYKNYNPNLNTKFTTYAYPYIVGEMKKLIREDKGIKISREITKLNYKIEKAYILLSQKLMKKPTVKELSEYLQIPEIYISDALMSLNKIQSIDEPISIDDKLTLQDVIGKSENIDELILLRDSLKQLTKDEKNIINDRYINNYTQSETSKMIGISQVQVSRKEQKILKKLKESIFS